MRKYASILIAILGCLAMFSGCVLHTTGDTEVGVRTIKWGFFGLAKAGVEEKVYEPGGTYFFLPLINDWDTFETRIQNMEMTIKPGKGDRKERDDLLFKTIDGNDIGLDVIIQYRLDPFKAPHVLQYVATSDSMLREKIVRTIARSKPRDIFGELKTEEFYVASKREEKAVQAKEILQEMLGPMGIEVMMVQTKDYRFNLEYQKAIEAKKVADQLVEKNKSAQHAATEEYKKRLKDAEGEVNKMVAQADGEFKKAKIEADAYYEKQEKLAKAILAEGEAEAKGIKKRNEAMAGAGGETMVKLRIAESMAGKKIILLPVSEGGMNLKTTNVNSLLELMGIQALSAQGGKP